MRTRLLCALLAAVAVGMPNQAEKDGNEVLAVHQLGAVDVGAVVPAPAVEVDHVRQVAEEMVSRITRHQNGSVSSAGTRRTPGGGAAGSRKMSPIHEASARP